MRFMLIVKASRESEAGVMPPESLIQEMGKFNQQMMEAGIFVDAAGLQSSAKGARIIISDDERSVLQGPFPETEHLISGYWIIQVASKEEAIQWASKSPNPQPGRKTNIEIRQLFEMEDFA